MSVIQCPICEDYIDTDMEDYDFEIDECEKCIFMKGISNAGACNRDI